MFFELRFSSRRKLRAEQMFRNPLGTSVDVDSMLSKGSKGVMHSADMDKQSIFSLHPISLHKFSVPIIFSGPQKSKESETFVMHNMWVQVLSSACEIFKWKLK